MGAGEPAHGTGRFPRRGAGPGRSAGRLPAALRAISSSAQTVALAKAQLHWSGGMNDPTVERLLTARHRAVARVLRLSSLKKYGQSPTFSFLAARSCFFDDAVRNGITESMHQVVIIGAGYDTRAWRLAQPGVRFYEVDHPATQCDKQKRAPAGKVTFVAVDLLRDSLHDRLITAGLLTTESTVSSSKGSPCTHPHRQPRTCSSPWHPWRPPEAS